MKNKKTAAILLAAALAFSAVGCGAAADKDLFETLSGAAGQMDAEAENSAPVELAELFTARDLSGEYGEYVAVRLSDSSASADGAGVSYENGVVTISAAGSYLLTGSLDGRVEVRVGDKDKVQLILSGAEIDSDGASAICAVSADKLFLTLDEGTENRITASGELAELGEIKADGAVFAKCDLTVNGTGSLSVKCENGHGIVSKDDLKIASGTLSVEALRQALSGKDSVSIADGAITLAAGGDGIHSENADADGKGSVNILGGTLMIASGDDGVHAEESLTVTGGSVTVSRCYEGLEAGDIAIWGGEIELTASDDGLNAAGGRDGSGRGNWGGRGGDPFAAEDVSITIAGGSLKINAQGDGIDSNGDLRVSGGTVLISGPTNGGNGAIDYNGSGVITGGTLIAAGASGMAENFSADSTQPSMLVSFSGTLAAGSEIDVRDADGRQLLSFCPEKNYQCAVISAPELSVGGTYTVSADGQSQSVTFDSVIFGGGQGFMGGPNGMGGGPNGFGGGPNGFGGGQNGFGQGAPDGTDGEIDANSSATPPGGRNGTENGLERPDGSGKEQGGRFDRDGGRGGPGGFGGQNGSGQSGEPPAWGGEPPAWGGGEDGTDDGVDIVSSATPNGGRA